MVAKQIKEGDKAKVSPILTGEKEWIEGGGHRCRKQSI